ncbi:multiple epidermal growth factor-like domains protein 10 isoform X7 [Dreissena polymorpha]|uniref:multiple epidermal growth factor-like domains protein 10 isoform X7 n=1 Tax=Dreissena polymorpha TaxID=45954 RepID=UPI002265150E|nr:multiple epidermal growth factor-like domains protein 10 isoform X7 [Dreissena polymorpha]
MSCLQVVFASITCAVLVDISIARECSGHGHLDHHSHQCVCEHGWGGDNCELVTDCGHHGHLSGSICVCDHGYAGTTCDVLCIHGHHDEHDQTKCHCDPGWTGKQCDHNAATTTKTTATYTTTRTPTTPAECSGHGHLDHHAHHCVCNHGWNGTHCEHPSCGNGNWNGSQCVCPNGLTGAHCEIHCKNHGIQSPKYPLRCHCGLQWAGITCDIHCTNGAQDHTEHNGCRCNNGWTGISCDQPDCGTHGHLDGHKCACKVHYAGANCEKHCQNNGTQSTSDPTSCHCQPRWAGLLCDIDCNHGIYNQSDHQKCQCDSGWTGDHCDYMVDGGWSDWSAWSDCPADSLVNTTKSRTRTCSKPSQQFGGANCTGHSVETDCCPVNGGIGSWTVWSVCSGICLDAYRVRVRQCNNPMPYCGGRYCGSEIEVDQTCIPDHCTTTTTSTVTSSAGSPGIIEPNMTEAITPNTTIASKTGLTPTITSAVSVTTTTATQIPTSTTQVTAGILSTVRSSTMSSPPTTSTFPPTTTTRGYIGLSETTTGTAVRPTAAPQPIQCTVCKVNPQLCFVLTKLETCPDSYCINEVTNNEDGSKWIDRRCGTYDECENDWWHSTSDDPDCQEYKPNENTMKDIHCTYCCTTDNCNMDIKPAQDTLYTHPKK